MGGRLPLLSLAVVACTACSEPPLYLLSSDGAHAAVLVTLAPVGGAPTARALSLDGPVTLEIDAETTRSVIALRYDLPLSTLGLPSGALQITETGSGLPKADRVDELDLSAAPVAWVSRDDPPEEVASMRFGNGFGCTPYQDREIRPSELGDREYVTALVASGPGRAFLGTSLHRAFELDTDGQLFPVELPTGSLISSAFRADDGEIWLLSYRGALLHGTPEHGFVAGPAIPANAEPWRDLDGPRGDAPFELYALSSSLAVQRYDGSAWRQIRDTRPMRDPRARNRLAWASPGRVVVIGSGTDEAVEVGADGSELVVPLSIPARLGTSDAVYGVGHVRGLGVVVGSRYLVLHLRHPDGSWERLAVPQEVPKAEVIIDRGNQSFLTGGGGQLLQWTESFGLCPAINLVASASFDGAAMIGDTVVLPTSGGSGTIFTFVAPTR